jgi:indolepyruvate ferredoxin oxidoreductase
MALAAVSLDDKYALQSGRVYLTGTQALVRLPIMQRARDVAAGLNTAGFITGYRGSPLGSIDIEFWRAERFTAEHHIHFQPGVNEDLAATAAWGSQQVGLYPGAKYDGVFAMWYGKGPGVDRSGDALKHANNAGTAPLGGVLALAGDDHTCKSSTLPHQSEYAFMDASIPVLNPAGVQEFLDYGLYGWALSRYSGLWCGFKTVAETVDTSASVSIDPERIGIVTPDDFEMPPGGLNIRWPDPPLDQERRLHEHKLYAALAFARANHFDGLVFGAERPRFGIVTAGKTYLDVRQALDDLGVDEAMARDIGLGIYKVAMVWPLEREGVRRFAEGLEEILVIEEKRALIENQLKEQLYNWDAAARPRVIGKFDEAGVWLLPSNGELTPARIARVISARIARFHGSETIESRLAFLDAKEAALAGWTPPLERLPHFCSGCPHNTSTRVPEGSRAMAGIGCHYMAIWMDRDTETFTQMGAEGATWIGQAPFTETQHVFQNIGDGTYFHSGLLAIRAAVAAGVNMTYKLLYNDAVAMTGGQPMDGPLSVPQITHQLYGEGVRRIAVVAAEPGHYPPGEPLATGVTLHHRDDFDKVQRDLRDHIGVSVLIYDQVCATELRRRRKRGKAPDPQRRVVINEAVCEGCGDCGLVSNCLAVIPVETEFGRKRAIDQSSCNKDMTCVKGFCPSFVTVEGAELRKPKAAALNSGDLPNLPEPDLPGLEEPYGLLITGVGGTGVVTIGALLGMAGHMDGRGVSVLDMTGLAQKYGAVVSHLRIAADPGQIHAVRIAAGGAKLVLGCDLVVAASFDALAKVTQGKTSAVVNTHPSPTGEFTRNPDLVFPDAALRDAISRTAGADHVTFLDATALAEALFGDSILSNMFLVGHAYQRGLIPISGAAIESAIRLNGVAVDKNLDAFLWGRLSAHDPALVEAAAAKAAPKTARPTPPGDLDGLIAHRSAELTAYQDAAYAARYGDLVARVRTAEAERAPGRSGLTHAVAHYYFKLLAYKDEYEVARLFADPAFERGIAERFESGYRLRYHLAPPFISKRDPETGRPLKSAYGHWMGSAFRLLARLRGLRGTALDPFGYSEERHTERRLIGEYEAAIEEIIAALDRDNHALAVEIAGLPERIRGYGHVKQASIDEAKRCETDLLQSFHDPRPAATAAE